MYKIFFTLIVSTFLSSCMAIGTPLMPAENGKVIENFPANKMALVVFKVSAPGASKWYRIDDKFSSYSSYQNPFFASNATRSGSSGHNIWIYNDSDYQVLMLKPGIYSLDTLYVDYNRYIIPSWNYGAWNQNEKEPFLIAFEALPETVTYIGDIQLFSKNISFNRSLPYQKIQDNFESAKSFFRSKYPEITSDFVKKLAFGKPSKKVKDEQ